MKCFLSNQWDYVDDFSEEYLKELPETKKIIDIPHTIKLCDDNYIDEKSYQKIVTYHKTFNINEDLQTHKVFLHFDGFMVKARIVLNNHELGTFVSGFFPVNININKYAKNENNELFVILDSSEDKNIPPFGFAVDYLTFGGIYRDVSLIIKPNIYIKNVFVNADHKGTINIKTICSNSQNPTFRIYDEDKLILETDKETINIPNPHLWSLEDPHLYALEVLLDSKYGQDNEIVKFGFKSAKFEKDGFYLNDKKIKLVGLNRHQSYPYAGYAMPKSMQEYDAEKLKEIGVNIVRTSHYSQSEYFLNRCDEIGLLVLTEVPGWQFVSRDEVWRNNYYDFIKKMVLKERNRTSLVAYGVRIDESIDDDELYKKGNQICHENDPYRQTTGVRNFKNSHLLEDFYSYNDFSCSSLKHGLDKASTVKTKGKGYLVTEYLGHMFPTKSFDNQERRQEHFLRHAKVLEDIYEHKNLAGGIGWCFADYNTHKDFGSGDHICYHGVLDIFRNKKYASAIYEAQNESKPFLTICSNMAPGDKSAALLGITYAASNCDSIKLYINDEYVNEFFPNRKDYPNTPHPLFEIDDYLGNRIKEKGFSDKDKKNLVDMCKFIIRNGYSNIKFSFIKDAASLMMKHHLKIMDLVNIYTKYINSWGQEASTFKFEGIKNKEVVITKTISAQLEGQLSAISSKQTLHEEESYDVAKIDISMLDKFGNICVYSSEAINVETSGPLEIYGPHLVSLKGGATSIFVKTKHELGE